MRGTRHRVLHLYPVLSVSDPPLGVVQHVSMATVQNNLGVPEMPGVISARAAQQPVHFILTAKYL